MDKQATFKAIIATSDEEKRTAYALRFQAFCVDYHYLPAKTYPDGLEHDQWDERAIIFLLYAGDEPVGTARLIPDSAEGFQTESYANLPSDIPRRHLAEVSRLTLSKRFSDSDKNARRAGLLELNKAMFGYSLAHDIYFWFTTMFVVTYKIYTELGVPFLPLSHELKRWPDNQGGLTIPQILDLRQVLPYLYLANRGLYEKITQTTTPPSNYDQAAMEQLRHKSQTEQTQILALIDKA